MSWLLVALLSLAAVALGTLLLRLRREAAALSRELRGAQRMVELANDPVLVADLVDGRLLLVNDACARLLGHDAGELAGLRLPALFPAAQVDRSAEVIADIWERRGLTTSELALLHADGSAIAVEISANVIDDVRRPAVLIYARDIRTRLAAERQISAYASQLEQINVELRETQAQLVQTEKLAALGNLAAGLSHEINTPIASILAGADTGRKALRLIQERGAELMEQGRERDRARLRRAIEALEGVCSNNHRAAQRISRIVGSLRSFVRLDEAEQKAVDLHEGLESALALLAHELHHRIEVVRSYGELPLLVCCPEHLNQVFMNLLLNAIQAVDSKGGRIVIITRCSEGRVWVQIADDGPGIPPDVLPRIFDARFTTKASGARIGAGLGLPICQRVVQQHGGRISVETEFGVGTTFTIELPLVRPRRTTSDFAPAPPRGRDRAARANPALEG